MNSKILTLTLAVSDGKAELDIKYNSKQLTKAQAVELQESVLKTVYEKLDKFQNLKKS